MFLAFLTVVENVWITSGGSPAWFRADKQAVSGTLRASLTLKCRDQVNQSFQLIRVWNRDLNFPLATFLNEIDRCAERSANWASTAWCAALLLSELESSSPAGVLSPLAAFSAGGRSIRL